MVSIEVIGIDHIYIAVSDMARSETFYDQIMPVLGFKKNSFKLDGELHLQYYNRHFGYVLRPSRIGGSFNSRAVGLHHFCFRVADAAAVNSIADEFGKLGVLCSAPELYPEYAPDYYAIYFEDPDGIRLEVTNYRAERRKRHDDWANA
jgi:glyoxylase I family protein